MKRLLLASSIAVLFAAAAEAQGYGQGWGQGWGRMRYAPPRFADKNSFDV